MKIIIAGIRRGSQYSPNHIGNDAAIFNLTADHLITQGCQVVEYSETEFVNSKIEADYIFNMARNSATINKLQELENAGKVVVNSAFGIQNCTRERMTRILISNHIPHPKSIIVKTEEPVSAREELLHSNCWVKRGDFHAIHREDVTFTRNIEETESVLHEFALRGIKNAVINEHLEGDLLKFYGVAGTDFFYWFYPNDLNHSKFGLEAINGKAQGIPFDLNFLKEICNKTAEVLNVDIYGGDAIVSADGSLKIIDFNDWPSFAPCRTEASFYIAKCIYQKVLNPKFEFVSTL